MTDTTQTPPAANDPVWWHKVVTDLLSPRTIAAFIAILALWSLAWWMLQGIVPDRMQALFGAILTAFVQLCMAASNWLWGKSQNEAMKDKAIQDLIAKTPPTETSTTTTTTTGGGTTP